MENKSSSDATSILDLKSKLETLITKDTIGVDDIKLVLDPITKYVQSPLFVKNIDGIVNIILTDRNGDKKFDLQDLQLLGKDALAITSLVSAILLLICSIPGLKLKYSQGATEELVFKLLTYVFLIILPQQVGHTLSIQEKHIVLDLSLAVYQTIESSQIAKDVVDKIYSQVKSNGGCSCFSKSKGDPMQEFPAAKLELIRNVQNARNNEVRNQLIN